MNRPRRHTCWQSKRLSWEGVQRWRARRVGDPRRTALPRGSTVSGLWWCNQFLGCPWPITLTLGLSWWHTHCPAKMDASEKDSGRWKSTWCLLLTFPRLFWLVVANSSIFLTRMSYCKIIHSGGYYGAWPGGAVSVSVFPLTQLPLNGRS